MARLWRVSPALMVLLGAASLVAAASLLKVGRSSPLGVVVATAQQVNGAGSRWKDVDERQDDDSLFVLVAEEYARVQC